VRARALPQASALKDPFNLAMVDLRYVRGFAMRFGLAILMIACISGCSAGDFPPVSKSRDPSSVIVPPADNPSQTSSLGDESVPYSAPLQYPDNWVEITRKRP
jgi:hypothetical protein